MTDIRAQALLKLKGGSVRPLRSLFSVQELSAAGETFASAPLLLASVLEEARRVQEAINGEAFAASVMGGVQ